MKKIALLLLVAMVAGLALAPQAEAKRRTRRGARNTAQQIPQPTVTAHSLEASGVTLLYNTIDAPAYYKVNKDDAGFSNGYADESFAIDWPTSLNGSEPVALQRALLNWLTSEEEQKTITSVDDLVNARTKCSFAMNGTARRVAKMPEGDSGPLCSMASVKVNRLTPKLLVYANTYEIYTGGGTNASFADGTSYLYYDLAANRVLTRDDVFRPEAVKLLEAELRDNADEWDYLWDEFKASPYLSENFAIEEDKVIFLYGKYEVAPGLAGNVEIEFPKSKMAPYMKIDIK